MTTRAARCAATFLSNACFWLDVFHADGLRVDAVSGIIYYDFCKEPGQYIPNCFGGRENLDGINFLRRLKPDRVSRLSRPDDDRRGRAPPYPMVTAPTYLGGLGFGFKWNMGWMNDILSYIKLDPPSTASTTTTKVTFSLFYAFSENYILPFSHDEVVHGKHSMLDKNPGDLWKKFAGLRALYGYTMAHPRQETFCSWAVNLRTSSNGSMTISWTGFCWSTSATLRCKAA